MRLLLVCIVVLASVGASAQLARVPDARLGTNRSVVLTHDAPQLRGCLHGPDEAPEQRMRVLAAINTARLIHSGEAGAPTAVGSYRPLSDLASVPDLASLKTPPAGFAVSLTTDGTSYAIAVKDTLDPCHFALFSDQEGVIYTARPIQ